MTSVKKAYSATWHCLTKNPAIFTPFIIFSVCEFIILILLFLSPRMPFKLLFGPPIKTFWGEGFLHYPLNFILLPKLLFLSRLALTVFLGSVMTGMAVFMTADIYRKESLRLKESFKQAIKKYVFLFLIVLAMTLLFYFSVKFPDKVLARYFLSGHKRLLFVGPRFWLGPFLFCANFLITAFIQAAFIYAIPVLLLEKKKFLRAIFGSFTVFAKLFFPTLLLLVLPLLVYLPVTLLVSHPNFLINKVCPEFVLAVLFFGIIINSLIIDPVVTVSATHLYLMHKDKK